jgi:serine protease AprX
MFEETNWLRENSSKICPLLRKKVIETYRPPGYTPCFLHRPVRGLRQRYGRIPVIIRLNKDHYFSALNNDNLSGVLGVGIKHKVDIINSFTTTVNVTTLKKIITHEGISGIWFDREIKALLDVAAPVVNAPPVWDSGFKGGGIGIAILDTGIYAHPDFTTPRNRIVAFRDFVNNRTQPYDDNGHGTHCAGDAAGNGGESGGAYTGAAPEANLVGIKVLNKTGSGAMSDLLAGIQWCVDNKDLYGIRILSMSLGARATASYKDDPMCQAVEKAWQAGIVVCAAAGNEGPDPGTVSTPGIDPEIITVGALDDKNTTGITDDTIASFSSRGPTPDGLTKPDLVVPGVNIIAPRAPNSYLDKNNKNARVGQWYISLSGTSMATPICAGVVALLLSSCPDLTPDNVKTLLMSTCRTVNPDPNAQGAGLVDTQAAIRQC